MEDLSDLLGDSKEQPNAAKRLPPNAGKGREKGVPNKMTTVIRDAIREALAAEGDRLAAADSSGETKPGALGYMQWLSRVEPRAFATLVGKLLPTQLTGDDGDAIKFQAIERRIVPAKVKA